MLAGSGGSWWLEVQGQVLAHDMNHSEGEAFVVTPAQPERVRQIDWQAPKRGLLCRPP